MFNDSKQEKLLRTILRIQYTILDKLFAIERKEDIMALAFQADLDALTVQAKATTDAEDAAVALLTGIAAAQAALQAKLDAAIAASDPAAIAAAQKQIQDANALLAARTAALGAAIVANTPAA